MEVLLRHLLEQDQRTKRGCIVASAKQPAFQFYPGDWMKDSDLRRCSLAAKGAWMDIICLSFECQERGRFSTKGIAWPLEDLARALCGDLSINLCALNELLDKGVLKQDDNGTYYVKRVVLDERKRALCGEAGKAGGGNPQWKSKGDDKGAPKGSAKGDTKRNAKASISTSSSSSVSSSTSEDACDPSGSRATADAVLVVFDHYRTLHPKSFKTPNAASKEWKLIEQRFRDGFTAMDLCDAIDGCHRCPHNLGENDRGAKYLSLELIMRTASQVQRFMEVPANGSTVLSGRTQATLRAADAFLAKRDAERTLLDVGGFDDGE